MSKNILTIIGSPRGIKGSSESIADSLVERLNKKEHACTKILLRKEIESQDSLVSLIDNADVIILSFPIYENSTPGLVTRFFELVYENKEQLKNKKRKMLVISNSGFPEPEANTCALTHCRLFAQEMGFEWMGGFGVAPGTLIDGKKLEEAGSTYKKVITLLNIIVESILNDKEIPEKALSLLSKPLLTPFIYRFFGKMISNGEAKKMGRDKYFAKPL